MALFENLLKNDAGKGLAIGIGVAILAPVVVPVIATISRPVARAAIKNGIVLYESGREKFAELGEFVDDMVAEAKAELEEKHADESHVVARTDMQELETSEQVLKQE